MVVVVVNEADETKWWVWGGYGVSGKVKEQAGYLYHYCLLATQAQYNVTGRLGEAFLAPLSTQRF